MLALEQGSKEVCAKSLLTNTNVVEHDGLSMVSVSWSAAWNAAAVTQILQLHALPDQVTCLCDDRELIWIEPRCFPFVWDWLIRFQSCAGEQLEQP